MAAITAAIMDVMVVVMVAGVITDVIDWKHARDVTHRESHCDFAMPTKIHL
eukprot:CAMPEP_0202712336 /NCGR_PEP_ID=MMETSP1385-20130828/38241_1 /ASSEMBLY_ACC=CAM_ASM_000861 /TAXON_ID=933848 /ORGANISM="Elphidium margaritaceum" /LENGTH=50 /DNA_ID=CAMNT_0049372341 /DNA_START=303 /DNA_END=455 /DNA_ORIENTATION=+